MRRFNKITMNSLLRNIPVMLLLGWLLLQINAVQASTAGDSLIKANDLYARKEYQQSLDMYLKLYKSGYSSPALLYNTGCAYFKTNDFVKAILFFERAKILDPSNDDIAFNLEVARARQVDKLDVIPEFFLSNWIKLLSGMMSSNAWTILAILILISGLGFMYLFFFAQTISIKRTFFGISLALFLFTGILIRFASVQKEMVLVRNDAIVVTPSITAKSSPDDAGTDLFLIHEGLKVTVENTVGNWAKIRLSNGTVGWLKKSDIEII